VVPRKVPDREGGFGSAKGLQPPKRKRQKQRKTKNLQDTGIRQVFLSDCIELPRRASLLTIAGLLGGFDTIPT